MASASDSTLATAHPVPTATVEMLKVSPATASDTRPIIERINVNVNINAEYGPLNRNTGVIRRLLDPNVNRVVHCAKYVDLPIEDWTEPVPDTCYIFCCLQKVTEVPVNPLKIGVTRPGGIVVPIHGIVVLARLGRATRPDGMPLPRDARGNCVNYIFKDFWTEAEGLANRFLPAFIGDRLEAQFGYQLMHWAEGCDSCEWDVFR